MQVAKAGENGAGDGAGPPPDRLRRIRWILAAVLVAGAGLLAATYLLQPKAAELKVPRVSLRVRETAHGFVLTRSEGERTIFQLQAALATQMQNREHTILQHVDLVVFDRDGVHADRISGEQFQYDPASGNVVAVGEVHIALEGRRAATAGAEGRAAAGSGRRNSPIEVTARRLWFNTKTGVAVAGGGLDFRYWNAVGHADAARVEAGSNRLVLSGDVRLRWAPPGRWPLAVRAGQAILDKAARTITLASGGKGGAAAPVVTMGPRRLSARQLVLRLGPDEVVRAAEAEGGVQAAARENGRVMRVSCQRAQLRFQPQAMTDARGPLRQPEARLAKLVLSGNVAAVATQADGRKQQLQAAVVTVAFAGRNEPTQAEAEQATAWVGGDYGLGDTRYRARSPQGSGEAKVQAPGLRFVFGPGLKAGQTVLREAATEGRGTVWYARAGQGAVRMEANQFTVALNPGQQIEDGQAIGDVVWHEAAAGKQAARRGTAGAAEAWLDPKTGQVARLVASGGVTVETATAGRGTATAGTIAGGRLTWTAANGVARLTPRNGEKVMATSAQGRLEAAEMTLTPAAMIASGGVSAAWMPARPAGEPGPRAPGRGQAARGTGYGAGPPGTPGGVAGMAGAVGPGLTGGSGPVNLTAARLTMSRDEQRGVFAGGVRVWRGSSMLQAATLRFNRARGMVTASGPGATGVRTTFLSPRGGRLAAGQTQLAAGLGASGGAVRRRAAGPAGSAPRPVAVAVTAPELRYWRDRELAEYSGGVRVAAGETELTCEYLKIEWAGRSGRPQRLVAGGGVEVRQPGRRAQGETAVYDARRRMVTLTGGSPSIYDAELGMLAGSALTFSPVNDTIRVESGPHTRTFAAYQVSH